MSKSNMLMPLGIACGQPTGSADGVSRAKLYTPHSRSWSHRSHLTIPQDRHPSPLIDTAIVLETINTSNVLKDNHMNTIEHEDNPSTDDTLDAQRDIIRQSINEIANDIGMKMRDVGLTFPLYITVRNSGDALVTIAIRLIHRIPIGSRHRQLSVGLLKRGLAAIGCEDENSPALLRTPGL